MKKLLLASVISLAFAAPALAMHCPADMKAIDDALAKNPQMSSAQMNEVKKLRADGETQHKAGQHTQSMDTLAKAKKMLGM